VALNPLTSLGQRCCCARRRSAGLAAADAV